MRRRNWFAIAFATVAMMFSYFAYAAAFTRPDDEPTRVSANLVGLGLALAPFVFVILAFGSHHPDAPKRVLVAMALLLVVGLPVGLLAPVLGAAAGFAAGGAVTLNRPPIDRVMTWRLWSVVLTVVYMMVLLIVATPAGVFTGGMLPLVMLGFADEYAAWREEQARDEPPAEQ